MSAQSLLLSIKGLKTYFPADEHILKAVDGVDLDIEHKKIIALIGESGCGKSVTAQSILRIVPSPGEIVSGAMLFDRGDGNVIDLAKLSPGGPLMRSIRGRQISMIFQEPMTSLSPVHTIGSQIIEAILLHSTSDKREARERAIRMISEVGMSNPQQRIDEYPHQLSGGMRQRAMIAMALSCYPKLLIADEPTTALDVTVQAQIIDLMLSLQDRFSMAIIFITHNLSLIAEIADTVNVMYLGRIVESAPTTELFGNPLHPYTRQLLKSVPKVGRKAKTRLETISGTVPIPLDPPAICGFKDRCKQAVPGKCTCAIPALVRISETHKVRCFLHSDSEEYSDE